MLLNPRNKSNIIVMQQEEKQINETNQKAQRKTQVYAEFYYNAKLTP